MAEIKKILATENYEAFIKSYKNLKQKKLTEKERNEIKRMFTYLTRNNINPQTFLDSKLRNLTIEKIDEFIIAQKYIPKSSQVVHGIIHHVKGNKYQISINNIKVSEYGRLYPSLEVLLMFAKSHNIKVDTKNIVEGY